MSKREVSESVASKMLSDFLNKHLRAGTGNKGKPIKAAAFANKSGIAASSISDWRNRIGGLPSTY